MVNFEKQLRDKYQDRKSKGHSRNMSNLSRHHSNLSKSSFGSRFSEIGNDASSKLNQDLPFKKHNYQSPR